MGNWRCRPWRQRCRPETTVETIAVTALLPKAHRRELAYRTIPVQATTPSAGQGAVRPAPGGSALRESLPPAAPRRGTPFSQHARIRLADRVVRSGCLRRRKEASRRWELSPYLEAIGAVRVREERLSLRRGGDRGDGPPPPARHGGSKPSRRGLGPSSDPVPQRAPVRVVDEAQEGRRPQALHRRHIGRAVPSNPARWPRTYLP